MSSLPARSSSDPSLSSLGPCPSPEPVLIQEVNDVTAVIHGVHILTQQLLFPLAVLEGLQTLCGDSLLSVGAPLCSGTGSGTG